MYIAGRLNLRTLIETIYIYDGTWFRKINGIYIRQYANFVIKATDENLYMMNNNQFTVTHYFKGFFLLLFLFNVFWSFQIRSTT